MWPDKQLNAGNEPDASSTEKMSLNDYFGHHTIDEKEALKYHSADTPEGLSRALNEQMGGSDCSVRPNPNEL